MSAAIKDATSCCSEEADPSAARVSVQMCTYVRALDCVCVCVCMPCKMIPSINSQFLMRTAIPDFVFAEYRCMSCAFSDGHISR